MTDQRHKEAIEKLLKQPGNSECAECFLADPTYCSLTLGIFLCTSCAKFHQKCISSVSEVVSLATHKWTKNEVDFLYTEGNIVVNGRYEKLLPNYYHRPKPNDPPILYEQWVLAKYIREEFKQLSQQSSYNQGTKTGALFKRAKDQERFQRRKFILHEPDGKLQYFIKYSDKNPKDSIPVRSLVNVYMAPAKVGNENGMQITYEKDGVRRNLYVFGEDGKSTSDWYHAMRASMTRHKYRDFPDADVKRYLNTTIIREGWMSKTGPKKLEKFRKRWFTLVGTAIWYYTNPLDAHPLSYIALGSKTFGYGVMKGFPKGIREEGHGLTIHTPERVYVLCCTSLDSREKWVESIEQVLSSCTTVWTSPLVGRLGHEEEKVINLDDIPDLSTPSNTTVFTDIPVIMGSENKKSASKKDDSSQRLPLFEKKSKKTSNDKYAKAKQNKNKHSGTVKISTDLESVKNLTVSPYQGSKKYSDDSEDSLNDDAPVVVSPRSKQEEKILSEEKNDRSRIMSSATDEDSDEDVVVILTQNSPDTDSLNPIRSETAERSSSMCNFLSSSEDSLNVANRHNSVETKTDQDNDHLPNDNESPVKRQEDNITTPKAMPRSPTKDPSQVSSGTSTPKKPPRRKKELIDSELSGNSSDVEQEPQIDLQIIHNMASSIEIESSSPAISPEKNSRSSSVRTTETDDVAVKDEDDTMSLAEKWRKNTFTSSRRVQGKERKTLKRAVLTMMRSDSLKSLDSSPSSVYSENRDAAARRVDITIINHMHESIWFMLFQNEMDPNDVDSYVTPWLGAEIAEMPASVGPISLPNEFEIAVIDTAPGGYGLKRTTGPFYAEPGDVWEVEIPVDDGSAPDMFYHEGMETEDGSVLVYSNVENSKKFEIAVFKSERKLFSRRNIKPGASAAIKVKPSLYIMPVDQDSYYDMEGEDVRWADISTKVSQVELMYRMPKTKIFSKKRGDNIYFSSERQRFTTRR